MINPEIGAMISVEQKRQKRMDSRAKGKKNFAKVLLSLACKQTILALMLIEG